MPSSQEAADPEKIKLITDTCKDLICIKMIVSLIKTSSKYPTTSTTK